MCRTENVPASRGPSGSAEMHLPAGVCCNLFVRDPGVVGMSWIHISTGNMMGFLSLFPPPASDPVSPMAELWGLRGRAQGRADVAHTVQTWASSPDFRVGEAMPVELPRHPWGPCATKHMTLCAVPCPSPVSPPPPCRQCSSTEASLGGCPDTGEVPGCRAGFPLKFCSIWDILRSVPTGAGAPSTRDT